MFEFEACEVFETKELTFVSDCFKYERNEEIGHYRQTLYKDCILYHLKQQFDNLKQKVPELTDWKNQY